MGLSPLVRGKRCCFRQSGRCQGSIPACAGETQPGSIRGKQGQVYPRLCGGNVDPLDQSPISWGLSPLVRGKHPPTEWTSSDRGSIPACAGETAYLFVCLSLVWVYPRLCGGNDIYLPAHILHRGLSPLVRGKPLIFVNYDKFHGSIPACAGETSKRTAASSGNGVYPRLCGGNIL